MTRRVLVRDIQQLVADYYGLKVDDIIGPSHKARYARPRHVAMYLAKRHLNRSWPDLARRFGGRDHTTIIHGVRATEHRIKTDPEIAHDVERLEAEFAA